MEISKQVFLNSVLLSALSVSSQASTVLLTFEGLADQQAVGDYYNGGAGGNLGVSFSSNALAINEFNQNEGMIPSPPNGVFFLSGAAATLNLAAGFTDGFSFFYSAPFFPGVINVYSGLNGTGTLLATLSLPTTTDGIGLSGCMNHDFCPFEPIGVSFSGTAESVDFGGTVNQIVFDNITVGASVPVAGTPEPGSWLLMATGIVLVAVNIRRRAFGLPRAL